MLQKISTIAIIIVCLIIFAEACVLTNQYQKQAEVIQVTGCGILLKDVNNNTWAIDYEQGYKVGDKVLITFDSRGTWDTMKDDTIVNVNKKRA